VLRKESLRTLMVPQSRRDVKFQGRRGEVSEISYSFGDYGSLKWEREIIKYRVLTPER